jgi:siderophore synthetase component
MNTWPLESSTLICPKFKKKLILYLTQNPRTVLPTDSFRSVSNKRFSEFRPTLM